MLLIGGSGDEELILDVDKVLTVVNHLDVCIGNRVLLGSA
jgi:CO dehydrogenase/acetyl-CoA synthase delta subunit